MILLAIFSFVSSYFVFYKLTNTVDTKDITSQRAVIGREAKEVPPPNETIMIGDGQGSPSTEPSTAITPDPSIVPTPSVIPSVLVSETPSVSATPSSTPTVIPTPLPSISAVPTPIPSKIAVETAKPANKIKSISFKVRVGSYDSRSEAEKKSKELESMGYDVSVIDEAEGAYVQLGSFREQDRALSLAEEVSQKGFSVIIRQIEE